MNTHAMIFGFIYSGICVFLGIGIINELIVIKRSEPCFLINVVIMSFWLAGCETYYFYYGMFGIFDS
jgi:hypothetical protein